MTLRQSLYNTIIEGLMAPIFLKKMVYFYPGYDFIKLQLLLCVRILYNNHIHIHIFTHIKYILTHIHSHTHIHTHLHTKASPLFMCCVCVLNC